MKRLTLVLGLIVLAVALILLATRPASLAPGVLPMHNADVANGELVFHAGGCASCHTSAEQRSEPALLGGGLSLHTPFGEFRVPNISPHPSSGIGGWSTLDFANAMLSGVSPDGRHYYPAFPYGSYTHMSLADLMDLKAYLDTLPEVDRKVGDHNLTFPWNIRAGIGLWKLFNLNSAYVTAVAQGDTQLERGRYLVEGLGHCAECHTPRDWTGGLDTSRWFGGARNPSGEGNVPNITAGKSGLNDWSQSDIEYYLESGFTPDFDTVGGSMVEVQENMALLPAADRAAIAAYLKYIPALD